MWVVRSGRGGTCQCLAKYEKPYTLSPCTSEDDDDDDDGGCGVCQRGKSSAIRRCARTHQSRHSMRLPQGRGGEGCVAVNPVLQKDRVTGTCMHNNTIVILSIHSGPRLLHVSPSRACIWPSSCSAAPPLHASR